MSIHDFKDTSIRIKGSTKNKLDRICKEYQYKKINDCIDEMITFFIQNGLSPKSNINLNLQTSLDKINHDFIKRDDSFRKWFGKVATKDIIELLHNTNLITEQNTEILAILSAKFKEEIIAETKESFNEIIKPFIGEEVPIKESNKLDKDVYYKLLDEKETRIIEEKNQKELHISHMKNLLGKIEKRSSFSSSLIIKLTKEEYEELEKLYSLNRV